MASSSYRLLFTFSLLLAFTYVNAEDPWWSFCNDNKKINSTQISSNIDDILPKLVSQTSVQGYTFLSFGSGNDRCIKEATVQIQKLCPNQDDARILYEFCFLRYDTHEFIGELDNSNGVVYASVENVTGDDAVFEKIVAEIKYTTIIQDLDRNARIEFANWEINLACSQCLATAVENFARFCKDKKGCRAIYSNCFSQYELYPIVYPASSANSTARNAYSRHMLP
ncbi:hypothetical protein MKX03_008876 [Papaver bracteatum]|nr:hypothetical protein MKX03_008876 [Papaver bracteatum]